MSGPYIYHFTHMDNLGSILAASGLASDRSCRAAGLTRRDIAYSNLKQKRMNTRVEVAPGGTLGDYVPFYFGPRSPMLLAYTAGRVTGSRENPEEIIYLVSDTDRVANSGLRFAFTDGHPVQEPKAFYNDLADLDVVDFPLMDQERWEDTNDDPDRKRRRQAEFLVYDFFPWEMVIGIGVRSSTMESWVEAEIRDAAYRPPCAPRPRWYY